jgi:hypothetical protein
LLLDPGGRRDGDRRHQDGNRDQRGQAGSTHRTASANVVNGAAPTIS